jgi:5-(carboxyamino)imidazole ribonucleotide mutase
LGVRSGGDFNNHRLFVCRGGILSPTALLPMAKALVGIIMGSSSDWETMQHAAGLKLIIAGAGGAAHLPGMTASLTTLPVLGVPVESKALKGLDSLLSIVQMPGGVPVATFAIGRAGAINAALFAASLLAQSDSKTQTAWKKFRVAQTANVLKAKLP